MTFKEAFTFPLKLWAESAKIADAKGHHVADFCIEVPVEKMQEVLDVVNGTKASEFGKARINGGYICNQSHRVILMRGWGYLTGVGGLNLKEEDAIRIQSEMQQYIVDQINK